MALLPIVPIAFASITALGVPGMTNTAHASASQSFSDMPTTHWAYDSIGKLIDAKLIDGYSDKASFKEKSLTRYELAFIVAKALNNFEKADDANKLLIDNLSSEFAPELNRLGAREWVNIKEDSVKKAEEAAKAKAIEENKNKPKINIGGETRLRFVSDNPNADSGRKLSGSDRFDFRQRIKFWGSVNEKIDFAARITTNSSNKFGNVEFNSGSEISLDQMLITVKDVWNIDSIRVGRSALDFYSNGLFGKAINVDGVLINKNWDKGKINFKGYTGNIKSNTWNGSSFTTRDSNQFTTLQVGYKASDKFNVKLGHYWADIPGDGSGGMGTLNTKDGSFSSSRGFTLSPVYKFGNGLTLLGDYTATTLNNVTGGLPKNPKGWALQLSNSKGPDVFYAAVNLVNPAHKGTDAWMVSYRSVDAGAVPSGAGGFDVLAVANIGPYDIFRHATDNVNAWFLAYQKVLMKNTVLSLEYQNFRIKNRGLTNLSSSKLNDTYMMKFEFFY